MFLSAWLCGVLWLLSCLESPKTPALLYTSTLSATGIIVPAANSIFGDLELCLLPYIFCLYLFCCLVDYNKDFFKLLPAILYCNWVLLPPLLQWCFDPLLQADKDFTNFINSQTTFLRSIQLQGCHIAPFGKHLKHIQGQIISYSANLQSMRNLQLTDLSRL